MICKLQNDFATDISTQSLKTHFRRDRYIILKTEASYSTVKRA